MMRICCAIVLLVAGTFDVAARPPQPRGPASVDEMVAAERAFAQTARVKGWRAAFLDCFDPNSIALVPDPVPARARLQLRPVRPFSEQELTWEPRAGDVANTSDLGWLTGPSTFIDHTAAAVTPAYGNYLSLWRKTGDTWRVLIDIGTSVTQPVSFPAGFTRVASTTRYAGGQAREDATIAMLEADRQLNAALRTSDAANAYVARMLQHARLHRGGTAQPVSVGAGEIRRWFSSNPGTMTATATAGDMAASSDLGFVYGKYELTGIAPQHGAYLRVWSRQADGQWRIAADVTARVE